MAITLLTDVSHYQGAIDWASVARTAYRAGVARMTIGRTTLDERGRANLKAMLGVMPVAGGYGVVGTAEPVEDGAKLLLDEIAAAGADPAKILVMLDAENFNDGTHPTIDQVDRYARQLRADLGRWPVAYVPDWWLDTHGYSVVGRGLANCPWAPSEYFAAPWTEDRLLAHKPAGLHGFKTLGWLQYTSSASIAGISGRVDANCFYGTVDQLRQQLIGGQQEDMTMAEVQDILNALAALRKDLTVDGTTGLADTIEKLYGRAKDAALTSAQVLTAVNQFQQIDAGAVAALVAGQLEVTGISTDPGGVVNVQFGPKTP
jgi:GH25 family lysozyme M1 (1,4-beta-N-acetylmuramidase)